jgi:alkanesulfonate monooxygenase SsuD/methylene tetrahydromethanopterin reductase-like flavin-dependent oxidoreductase (luciferase family)
MLFSIFNLLGYRDRDTSVASLYDNAIDAVRHAEQAGFEIAWFAEHHFSNYSACPSPLMMCARLAGETTRIKLAPGVVVIPLYHPVRLMSEIGMVSTMSHGRLVLGIGSGYQPYEFDRFDEDLADSTEKLIEFMEMMELAFENETFSFDGKHFKIPETHITTRPEAGMPDVWVAGDNPMLGTFAARKGYASMVTPRHFTPALLKAARGKIEDRFREANVDPARLRLGVLRHVCVTDDRNEALHFLDHVRHQIRVSQALRRREELLDGSMIIERPYDNEPSLEEMAEYMLVGDAETIAERIVAEAREAGTDQMLLQFQAGGTDHATTLRSIERFATDVRPQVEKALAREAAA